MQRGRELETYLGIPHEAIQAREAQAAQVLPRILSQTLFLLEEKP
jgi:hypothetical protein